MAIHHNPTSTDEGLDPISALWSGEPFLEVTTARERETIDVWARR